MSVHSSVLTCFDGDKATRAGRPVAPFMSRQNVCGSGFTALRFGWVKFDFTTPDSTAQVYAGEKNNLTSDEALNVTNLEFGK